MQVDASVSLFLGLTVLGHAVQYCLMPETMRKTHQAQIGYVPGKTIAATANMYSQT